MSFRFASALALTLLASLHPAAPAPCASAQAGRRARPEGEPQGERPGRDLRGSLQPAIDQAIERGVAFLLDAQLRDGSWDEMADQFGPGATALVAFALMKSGLQREHPAVERAMTFLDGASVRTTYSNACLVLAYAERGYDRDVERVEALVDQLLSWQTGAWSYPVHPVRLDREGVADARPNGGGVGTELDLSNTQFAALALRAAAEVGVTVPTKAWQRLLDTTLAFQDRPTEPEDGSPASAPFRYRQAPTTREGRGARGTPRALDPPTLSMCAAGIAVLEICRDGLGRSLSKRDAETIDRAQALGLQWMVDHFTVEPGPISGRWHRYTLYGIERVAALLELERFGEHDWYAEGVRALVVRQKADGSWFRDGTDADTCFALLFLRKATAPRTGPDEGAGTARDSVDGDLHVRATGTNPVSIWVTGFAESVDRPRVREVHYLVDGELVATVEGDAREVWEGEQLAVRHDFTRPGKHAIEARAHLVAPDAPRDATEATILVRSEPLEVEVSVVRAPWMVEAAAATAANLLRDVEVRVEVSSPKDDAKAGPRAVDGFEGTGWFADFDDAQPWISLRFERPVRANVVTLSPLDARPRYVGMHDRLVRAELVVDGDDPIEVRFDEDVLRPAVIRLDRPHAIRKLEVRLVERVPGSGERATVGLAEIGLQLVR